MATPGVINQSAINTTAINGDKYSILVSVAEVTVNINKAPNALINQNRINTLIINGLVTNNNIRLTQTHILTVANANIEIDATSPNPAMVFTFVVDNISVTVTSEKVFIEKGQGGVLLITITEPDTTTHRFSFEGLKA